MIARSCRASCRSRAWRPPRRNGSGEFIQSCAEVPRALPRRSAVSAVIPVVSPRCARCACGAGHKPWRARQRNSRRTSPACMGESFLVISLPGSLSPRFLQISRSLINQNGATRLEPPRPTSFDYLYATINATSIWDGLSLSFQTSIGS